MTSLHGITYKRLRGHPERVEEFRLGSHLIELIPSEAMPGWWFTVDYSSRHYDGFYEKAHHNRTAAINHIERLLTTSH